MDEMYLIHYRKQLEDTGSPPSSKPRRNSTGQHQDRVKIEAKTNGDIQENTPAPIPDNPGHRRRIRSCVEEGSVFPRRTRRSLFFDIGKDELTESDTGESWAIWGF